MGLDPAQCYLDTLLQDVAEFSCELHAAATRHIGDFYEKYASIATGTVGYEARDNTWTTNFLVSDLSNELKNQNAITNTARCDERGARK